ncbi:hypothetical protein Btru_050062 [Bulinus truncatus]|nr:hypothetical protein Btru_050062 [Bulinus truncatus]
MSCCSLSYLYCAWFIISLECVLAGNENRKPLQTADDLSPSTPDDLDFFTTTTTIEHDGLYVTTPQLIDCETTKWGLNCNRVCSSRCYQKRCERLSGLCNHGCIGFSDPPICREDCSNNTYGPNCSMRCSEECKGRDKHIHYSCHHVTGKCLPSFQQFQAAKSDIAPVEQTEYRAFFLGLGVIGLFGALMISTINYLNRVVFRPPEGGDTQSVVSSSSIVECNDLSKRQQRSEQNGSKQNFFSGSSTSFNFPSFPVICELETTV